MPTIPQYPYADTSTSTSDQSDQSDHYYDRRGIRQPTGNQSGFNPLFLGIVVIGGLIALASVEMNDSRR